MTQRDTVPVTVNDTPRRWLRRPRPSAASRLLAALRFVSGTLAAGLFLLTAAVAVAAVMSGDRPGPGVGAVTGHAVIAVVAIALQVVADRRRGAVAVAAALLVLPLAAATLWFWWWN